MARGGRRRTGRLWVVGLATAILAGVAGAATAQPAAVRIGYLPLPYYNAWPPRGGDDREGALC